MHHQTIPMPVVVMVTTIFMGQDACHQVVPSSVLSGCNGNEGVVCPMSMTMLNNFHSSYPDCKVAEKLCITGEP
jgi:hypothetical protein